MSRTDFISVFSQTDCILGEGAVIERLRRDSDFELDAQIVNSGFVYDDAGRAAMEAIYRQYMDAGAEHLLPLVLSTATWRASKARIEASPYAGKDVNRDNFVFLDRLRKRYGDYADRIFICGLLSCRGDAYGSEEPLSAKEAEMFHTWQADKLAQSGVDFLMAATLPALSEAQGLAAALAATGLPYIISFVARSEGTLIDGTPLKDAIDTIDAVVAPQPLAFMINCTHASIFKTALMHPNHSSPRVRQRVCGLLANTAALDPEALDNSAELVSEPPDTFSRAVAALKDELGMKILGGCCGTDDRHIRQLAARLAGQRPV